MKNNDNINNHSNSQISSAIDNLNNHLNDKTSDNRLSSDLKTYRSNFSMTKEQPWLRISEQHMMSFNLAENSQDNFDKSKAESNVNTITLRTMNRSIDNYILTIDNLTSEERVRSNDNNNLMNQC